MIMSFKTYRPVHLLQAIVRLSYLSVFISVATRCWVLPVIFCGVGQYSNKDWKPLFVRMSTLSSLAVPMVVVRTTCAVANVNKLGIVSTLCVSVNFFLFMFQLRLAHHMLSFFCFYFVLVQLSLSIVFVWWQVLHLAFCCYRDHNEQSGDWFLYVAIIWNAKGDKTP